MEEHPEQAEQLVQIKSVHAGISTTDKSQQDCRKVVRRFSRLSENYGREERESKVRERMRKSKMSTKDGRERKEKGEQA